MIQRDVPLVTFSREYISTGGNEWNCLLNFATLVIFSLDNIKKSTAVEIRKKKNRTINTFDGLH